MKSIHISIVNISKAAENYYVTPFPSLHSIVG